MASAIIPNIYTTSYDVNLFDNRNILQISVIDPTQSQAPVATITSQDMIGSIYTNEFKNCQFTIDMGEISIKINTSVPTISTDTISLIDINNTLQILVSYNLNKFSKNITTSSSSIDLPVNIKSYLTQLLKIDKTRSNIVDVICMGGFHRNYDSDTYTKNDNNLSESELINRELLFYKSKQPLFKNYLVY